MHPCHGEKIECIHYLFIILLVLKFLLQRFLSLRHHSAGHHRAVCFIHWHQSKRTNTSDILYRKLVPKKKKKNYWSWKLFSSFFFLFLVFPIFVGLMTTCTDIQILYYHCLFFCFFFWAKQLTLFFYWWFSQKRRRRRRGNTCDLYKAFKTGVGGSEEETMIHCCCSKMWCIELSSDSLVDDLVQMIVTKMGSTKMCSETKHWC